MKNVYPEKQASIPSINYGSRESRINNLNGHQRTQFSHQMSSSFSSSSSSPPPSPSSSFCKSVKSPLHHHSYRLYPESSSKSQERRKEEGSEERRMSSTNGKSSRIGSFVMSVTLSFIISLTLVYYFSPLIAHHLPTLSSSSSSRLNQFFPQSLSRVQEDRMNDVSSDDEFSSGRIPELMKDQMNESSISEEMELNRKVQMISMILPDDSVVVTTKSGKVLGYKVKELSTTVSVFLGIPYARPPVGPLRFKKPKPIVPWKGLRDATRFGHQCIQYKPNRTYTPWISSDDNMSEDCLTLNIWTPNFNQDNGRNRSGKDERDGSNKSGRDGSNKSERDESNKSERDESNKKEENKLKPVMIWIHGGAFFSGSSDVPFYDGRTLAAFGDVVIVTMNYRLGVFGFYDAHIPDSPGNQGLYDQVMAMKWIHENIHFFGGNPESVTLFGQSAGAISIGLHYLSPLSRKYFKRGILESGSPTVPRIFYERDLSDSSTNKVPELARKVGCLDPSERNDAFYERSESIVTCLRRTDLKLLESAQSELIQQLSLAFGPTSGDDFLPDLPFNLLHDRLNQASELSSSSESTFSSSLSDSSSFFSDSSHSSPSSLLPTSPKFQEDDDGGDSKEELEGGEKDSNHGNADDAKVEDESEDEKDEDTERKEERKGSGTEEDGEKEEKSGAFRGTERSRSGKNHEDREGERMRRKKEGIRKQEVEGKKELLIGVNKDEGSFFLHFLDPRTFSSNPKNISYEESIEFVKRSFNFLPDSFSTLVTDMFLSWTKEKDPVTIRNALAHMIGDSTFTCPATLFANLVSPVSSSSNAVSESSSNALSKVYFYVFDHSSSISPWDKWMGVLHFDEVPFVFGHPVRYPHIYTKSEISFSRLIMNYWVNFAKTGSPSGILSGSNGKDAESRRNESSNLSSREGIVTRKEPTALIWPIYTKEEPKFMSLNPFNVSIVTSGVREETCSKWRILLENS